MDILITVGIFPPDVGGPASFVPKIAKKPAVKMKASEIKMIILIIEVKVNLISTKQIIN